MRKLNALVLAGVLVGSLAHVGCVADAPSSPEPVASAPAPDASTSVEEPADAEDGEWEVNTEFAAKAVPEEEAAIFHDAILGVLDVNYEPIAVLGRQTVAGVTYAYLCQAIYWEDDAVPVWSVVVVHDDPEGTAQLLDEKVINVANVRTGDAALGGEATGAWAASGSNDGMLLPEGAQQAFDKAMEGYDGVRVSPIALLGTRAAGGTDYRVLAQGPSEADAGRQAVYVVDVHEDPVGVCGVTEMAPLDLNHYVAE